MLFQENKENQVRVAAAFAIIEKAGVGVDIPVQKIENALKCRRGDSEWSNLRHMLGNRVKREMHTHLVSVRNHTLRALTKAELRDWYPKRQWKKRWRSTTRERFALANAEEANMSVHQRRRLMMQRDALAKERRTMREEKNRLKKTTAKTAVNPVRRLPVERPAATVLADVEPAEAAEVA